MRLLRVGRVIGRAALLLLLGASAARAGDYDLVLWRLGHPDPIKVCTVCDGTDRTGEDGSPDAQKRFARMATALGLSFVPAFGDPGSSIGQSGLELGFATGFAFPKLDNAEWPGVGTQAQTASPGMWVVPELRARKGFGSSFEVGTSFSLLAGSSMVALSAELRWALVDGIDYAPDVALRAWGTRVLGTQELDLSMTGADAIISKAFGVGGVVSLVPYGQVGITCINVSSGVIDFNPAHEDLKDPTADDGIFHNIGMFSNRYTRFALGLRAVAGAAVVGLEGNIAFGTNPVQTDALPAGVVADTQFTRQWGATGHLGFQF